MSFTAYSGNVTCWLIYQLFSSYIRKESPAEIGGRGNVTKPSDTAKNQQLSDERDFKRVRKVKTTRRDSCGRIFFSVF